MHDGGVGRLLVASLHQAIADLLPARLEFYEAWLNPRGLRDGRIGLGPLAAVLSFLRQEGEMYRVITTRAGEYAAEWTVAHHPALRRALVEAAPAWLRTRLAMKLAGRLVRRTYSGSRTLVRWRDGRGTVDLRGSVFCEVRDRTADPLCHYYAAAIGRVLTLFSLDPEVGTETCRARDGTRCVMRVAVRRPGKAR